MAIKDYQHLQKLLDKVIGEVGLEKTIVLLQSFLDHTQIKMDEIEKGKLIVYLVTYNALKVYGLKDKEFYDSQAKEYRDARMACHHVLKKYTSWSYAKIGQAFDRSERNCRYYCEKVEEFISAPDFYRDFIEKYNRLETQFLQFLGKLG